ncbi:DNA-binding transcriptional regulator [soil metagenome]
MPVNPTRFGKNAPLVAIVLDISNVFGRSILRGVMKVASTERRWATHKDFWRTTESLTKLPKCDGAIITALPPDQVPLVLSKIKHVVSCSGGADPTLMPVVSLDDVAVGAMGAEHLLNCQLEHFAFYPGGHSGWVTADNRRKGFINRLKSAGFDCHISPITLPPQPERLTHAHRPAVIAWLGKLPKPCGVLGLDDDSANDLAEACQEAGLSVPDQIAILGINNDDLTCELAWPPMSSIDAGFNRLGYHAARMLDRMMMGEKLKPEERVIRLPPLGVMQRVSTSLMAVSDPNLSDAVRYIREHACDPCTVHEVLRHVPISRRSLERQFADQFGRTPHDEITRVRIEQAKRLLVSSQLTLNEITERCGYSGVQNLARSFRKETGMTPAAYRRDSARGAPSEGTH